MLYRNPKHKFCVQFFLLSFFFFLSFFLSFSPPENLAVCEMMWKNILERGRPQMTIRRMPFVFRISKATNTFRLCNTRCFSTTTLVARTRLIVSLYVYCLFCSSSCRSLFLFTCPSLFLSVSRFSSKP